MKALVTGDEGFVGQHLKALLQSEGMSVVGFDLAHGEDIRSYEAIRSRLERVDPDYVFHLAAQASPPEATSDPRRGLEVNLIGTLNLLEAMRHTGIHPKTLIAGTSEEIGYEGHLPGAIVDELTICRPTQPYGVSKLAATTLGLVYARQYGMPVVITRAFNHIGPGVPARYAVGSFARRVVEVELGRRHAVTHGNLTSKRNFCDVRDVVRAYRLAIDYTPGSTFIVCGESDWTVPMSYALGILVAKAKVDIPTEVDPSLFRSGEQGEFPIPSHDYLTRVTSWKPEIDLDQSLSDVLDWCRGVVS